MAFVEMLGLASILPFIGVLSNPEIIDTNNYLRETYNYVENFGIKTRKEFIFFLGIFVFVLLIVSLTFKATITYLQVRFNTTCQYNIGRRILKGYLNKPYSWFLNRNSSELGKNILTEVNTVVSNGLSPLVNLVVQSIMTLTILSLLIVVDPKLALTIGLILGLFYVIVYRSLLDILNKKSRERFKDNKWRFTAVSEAFGAVKEIKLSGLEQTYIDRFSEPAKSLAKNQASLQVIGKLPRYAIEAIAFGGMLLIVLYLIAQRQNFTDAVPIIALYVFAGYRLMPTVQQIYISATQLRSIIPALNALYEDISTLEKPKKKTDNQISFNNSIVLSNLDFNYPNSKNLALKNINVKIKAGTKVGIIGTTGSGKTTLIDLILGLLEPTKGKLKVDDKLINIDNLRPWQSLIGYVPQQIYLADDTIAANIAFGEDPKNIKLKDIESVAKITNIHDFISKELPFKYQTKVGERGIRLSGGQIQRIGIARAIFRKPKILVLDEATSALDNLTEKLVLDELYNFNKNATIILITHRVTSIKKCDNIYLIDRGEIKGEGTFDKLGKENSFFQRAIKNT
tara:strand:- start:2181 stop:3887 length:1707 start_codon:yes stop_codon:yes gene_type:complete